MKTRFFLFLIVIFTPGLLLANAWVIPEEKLYLSLSYSDFTSDGLYIGKTKTRFRDAPPFGTSSLKQRTNTLYGEYGLAQRSSVSIVVPFTQSNGFLLMGTNHPAIRKIGDVRLVYKHVLYQGEVDFAFSGGIKIPGGYDERKINSFGKGQLDYITRISISKFFESRFFTSVDFGIDFREGPPHNDLNTFLEIGYSSPNGWTPRVYYETIRSQGGLDIAGAGFNGASRENGFPATRENKTVFGGSLTYQINKSFDVGISYSRTLSGRNTDFGRTYTFSTGYSFD